MHECSSGHSLFVVSRSSQHDRNVTSTTELELSQNDENDSSVWVQTLAPQWFLSSQHVCREIAERVGNLCDGGEEEEQRRAPVILPILAFRTCSNCDRIAIRTHASDRPHRTRQFEQLTNPALDTNTTFPASMHITVSIVSAIQAQLLVTPQRKEICKERSHAC